MANWWVANGSSYITFPTLGNLLSSTITVRLNNLYWPSSTSYAFSQRGSTTSTGEFALYRVGDNLSCTLGGTTNGSFLFIPTNFGSSLIDYTGGGYLEFTVNMSTGAWSLDDNSGNISSGTFSVGAGRVDGMLGRIGARSDSDTSGGTGGATIVPSGFLCGDVQITIDSTLQRNYVPPGSGASTTVPDVENSQDGTLRSGSGDGSDWDTDAGGSQVDGSVSEALALADSQSSSAEYPVSISESVGFSDGQTVSLTALAAVVESLSLADSQSASRSLVAAISEAITLAESQSTGNTIAAIITEAIGLSDAQLSVMSYSASITEGLSFTDSQTNTAVLLAQISESVALLDASTIGNIILGAVSEALSLSDAQTSIISIEASVSEALNLSDTQTSTRDIIAALTEGVSFDDAIVTNSVLLSGIVESLALTDAQTSQLDGEIFYSNRIVKIAAFDRVVKISGFDRIVKIED